MLLVGVGGGGCRMAATAGASLAGELRVVGFDTDALAARSLTGMRCHLIGVPRLDGHATGGDMVKGRAAAQDDVETLRKALSGARTAVVVISLGGGVGGGAAPVILKMLRDLGTHTLCFATLPFEMEGKARRSAAERALPLLEEYADALAVVPLDDLFADAGGFTLAEAVPRADERMAFGLTLLWRLVRDPGFIPLDLATLHEMLRHSGGRCRFAVASSEGPGRGNEAVALLGRSALLGRGFQGAQAMMLGILGGDDLCLAELSEISKRMQAAMPSGCRLRMGTVLDDRLQGRLHLVVLLFDAWSDRPAAEPDPRGAEGLIPEILVETGPGRGRGGARGSKLSFGATGRGRFKGVETTLRDGEDLDIPTYLRRGITLDR